VACAVPHNFGKNAQNTTSIPALFACIMHQSHQRSQRQALISVSLDKIGDQTYNLHKNKKSVMKSSASVSIGVGKG
jgi:hypothetical protein